jgi:hypothetical protein
VWLVYTHAVAFAFFGIALYAASLPSQQHDASISSSDAASSVPVIAGFLRPSFAAFLRHADASADARWLNQSPLRYESNQAIIQTRISKHGDYFNHHFFTAQDNLSRVPFII